jgi:hypothetical protein
VLYLNVHEENGYIVQYHLQDGYHVNIKGKTYGPFDERSLTFARDSKGNTDFNKFYYTRKKGELATYHVHLDGNEEGPFGEVRFPGKHDPDREFLYMLDGKWYARNSNGASKNIQEAPVFAYFRRENGKYHVNVNGRDSKGYDQIWGFSSSENGKYAYLYGENGKHHVMINIDGTEKSSRGYDYVDYGSPLLTESGKYAYQYNENEKWHVMTNTDGTEKSSRGYDNTYGFHLTKSGKYAYAYQENEKWYVMTNINGTEKSGRGYDNVRDLQLTENGKYAYKYEENEKWHVIINIDGTEKSSRGYDGVEEIHLAENGKYAYLYEENRKLHVNANGKESVGYDNLTGFEVDDKGNYSFYDNHDDGRVYRNDNGKESKTEYLTGMEWWHRRAPDLFASNNLRDDRKLEIYSPDKKHSFDSSYDHAHVVIDGRTHGRAPALYAWYDAEKNAFIWNAIEDRELVVYEYKL